MNPREVLPPIDRFLSLRDPGGGLYTRKTTVARFERFRYLRAAYLFRLSLLSFDLFGRIRFAFSFHELYHIIKDWFLKFHFYLFLTGPLFRSDGCVDSSRQKQRHLVETPIALAYKRNDSGWKYILRRKTSFVQNIVETALRLSKHGSRSLRAARRRRLPRRRAGVGDRCRDRHIAAKKNGLQKRQNRPFRPVRHKRGDYRLPIRRSRPFSVSSKRMGQIIQQSMRRFTPVRVSLQ